jgi:hypothetical protein
MVDDKREEAWGSLTSVSIWNTRFQTKKRKKNMMGELGGREAARTA